MPTGVSDNGLPYTTPSIVVVAIDEPLIRQRSAALGRLQDIDGASFRAVEVPDVDLSIVGSGINVSRIRGGRRTEVTPNQSLQYAMPAEGDETAVVWMGRVSGGAVRREAVVKVCGEFLSEH